jgi:hypothetical protein
MSEKRFTKDLGEQQPEVCAETQQQFPTLMPLGRHWENHARRIGAEDEYENRLRARYGEEW